MDALTARFYDSYAAGISDATENRRSAMMGHVATALQPGARVLDVGSGSGRDVAAMLEIGLQAWGVEPALLMALPEMEASRLANDRDGDGRRFHNHAPADVARLLAPLGFTLEQATVNDVVLQANGTRWHMLVFRRAA